MNTLSPEIVNLWWSLWLWVGVLTTLPASGGSPCTETCKRLSGNLNSYQMIHFLNELSLYHKLPQAFQNQSDFEESSRASLLTWTRVVFVFFRFVTLSSLLNGFWLNVPIKQYSEDNREWSNVPVSWDSHCLSIMSHSLISEWNWYWVNRIWVATECEFLPRWE